MHIIAAHLSNGLSFYHTNRLWQTHAFAWRWVFALIGPNDRTRNYAFNLIDKSRVCC